MIVTSLLIAVVPSCWTSLGHRDRQAERDAACERERAQVEAVITRAFEHARAREYRHVLEAVDAVRRTPWTAGNRENLRCMALVGLGTMQRAEDACVGRRYLPPGSASWLNIALIYLSREDTRRARIALGELLRGAPRNLQAKALLADADWLDGACGTALDRFEAVHRANHGAPDAILGDREQLLAACNRGESAEIEELGALARRQPMIPIPIDHGDEDCVEIVYD